MMVDWTESVELYLNYFLELTFSLLRKILIILKIFGEHKSDNSKIQAPLRILATFAHRVQNYS